MNAVLDRIVERFKELDEDARERYRGILTAFRNLYGFLAQIIPYQDSQLEKLYALVRNLLTKLLCEDEGDRFELDDEVTLKYFRLRQIGEGAIDLGDGEADPLKGPTDVGTARTKDDAVELSSYFERVLEELFIERMDGNENIFKRVMGDKAFRGAAHEHIARQVWERVDGRDLAPAVNTPYIHRI